jgi:hypothetical protein
LTKFAICSNIAGYIKGGTMRFTVEIEKALNKKVGKGKWKIRHAIHWATSLAVAKRKKLDPTKAWAVSILNGSEWSHPTHAVVALGDLKEVI